MNKGVKMKYIQRKDRQFNYLETVDEFETFREALKMLKEYRLADPIGDYYISQRCCNDWRNE